MLQNKCQWLSPLAPHGLAASSHDLADLECGRPGAAAAAAATATTTTTTTTINNCQTFSSGLFERVSD